MGGLAQQVKRRHRAAFEDRFLAFVDILGFRHLVKRMKTEPDLLPTVRNALKGIDNQVGYFKQYYEERQKRPGKDSLSDLSMVAFSDCYVISMAYKRHGAWRVLAGVHALGTRLLARGILCRG